MTCQISVDCSVFSVQCTMHKCQNRSFLLECNLWLQMSLLSTTNSLLIKNSFSGFLLFFSLEKTLWHIFQCSENNSKGFLKWKKWKESRKRVFKSHVNQSLNEVTSIVPCSQWEKSIYDYNSRTSERTHLCSCSFVVRLNICSDVR